MVTKAEIDRISGLLRAELAKQANKLSYNDVLVLACGVALRNCKVEPVKIATHIEAVRYWWQDKD